MEPSSTTPRFTSDTAIRKIAAFDVRLQCYTPQYTFLLGYVLINIFLFFYNAVREFSQWPHDPFQAWFISIARGFGSLLNFNIALQMILASQNLLTFLRRTRLSLLFPLDQAMPDMHIIVGMTTFVAANLHSFFHVVPGLRTNEWQPGFGKWTHLFVTGVVLLLVVFAMVITSTPTIRSANFEVFSIFHLIGTAILLLLLIFHGLRKAHISTSKWILGPTLLYFLDRISVMMTVKTSSVKVKLGSESECLLCEGGIVRLSFKKPFKYRAGQYAQLCVPLISKTQWHPFTFASAPYEEKVLFFIKQKGDWTKALYNTCSRSLERRCSGSVLRFEVKIRGPYGSPAQHASQYDRVIFISGGVGATPFCSLTKEMTNDFLQKVKRDTERGYGHYSSPSDDGEPASLWDSTSSLDEPVSDLFKTRKTASPVGFLKSQRKQNLSNSADTIFTNSSQRGGTRNGGLHQDVRVPEQTWAQFFYTISSTSIFNTTMLWLLLVRLFIDMMSIAFGYSDLCRQGSEIFRSTWVRWADFVMAVVFWIGLCFAIVSEMVSESRMFAEEVLISIPVSGTPVVLGILPLFRMEIPNGELTFYYFIVVWPMAILLFLLRYFRSLRERALLSGTAKQRHEPCTSVDFIWTARTQDEDVWLMEELLATIRKTRFVRLHRFITRQDEWDVEDRFDSVDRRDSNMLCRYGRPNWKDMFTNLTSNVKNGSTIGIFFCGPAEMGTAVKQAAILSMLANKSFALSLNVRYVYREEKL